MTTYEQVARRWRDRCLGLTDRPNLRAERMPVDGDQIYSYGFHFELARPLRNPNGTVHGFLLNGDRYSVSTSRHQQEVRSALRDQNTVTIPHEALNAAGIERRTVRIVHVTRDRYVSTRHESTSREDAPLGWMFVDLREQPGWEVRLLDGYPKQTGEIVFDGQTYRWTTQRHWLGESLISAEVAYTVRCTSFQPATYALPKPTWPESRPRWRRGEHATWSDFAEAERAWFDSADAAAYREAEDAYRNSWVGSSCPRHGDRCDGRIRRRRRAFFLSGFDQNEPRPSYFFCELPPGAKPTTVEEAYAALKPETVRLAEAQGREVKRQGDIFAIPVPTVTKRALAKAGATFMKRGDIFRTNHQGTEVAILPDGTTLARGCLRHVPEGRRPDHRRLTLGRDFHVLVKNTVPLAA
jgi:hypothetical protein